MISRRARRPIAFVVVAMFAAVIAGIVVCGRARRTVPDEGAIPAPAHDAVADGELRVRVRDADTGLPIIARLTVRSIDGTAAPTKGGASGPAGGMAADVRGDLTTKLPPGHYRVAASKGLEWSVDAETVEIAASRTSSLELRPRHVIRSAGLVACDLHVHALPTPGSTVTVDERMLSLASAGIQFAVATEQNVVGDYAAAASRTDLSTAIALVSGIEVTTRDPAFGHFGEFPWPKGEPGPPFTHTDAASVFLAGKRGDDSRVVVVHHPRDPSGAGYFQAVGFDPTTHRIPAGMSPAFDMIEVYDGHDLADRSRTEAVMSDWLALLEVGKRYLATGGSDSFGLGYPWAGYPRTYVDVSGDLGGWRQGYAGAPLDTAIVLDSLRKGRSFVTSGPLIDFEIEASGLGGRVTARGPVGAHLRVRAAPWIDVTRVEVIAGGTSIYEAAIPSRPTTTGKEPGSLDEATERAVRFESALAFTIPPGARWVVAVVRGERPYDDVLPGMPVQPLAFTNPIWLTR